MLVFIENYIKITVVNKLSRSKKHDCSNKTIYYVLFANLQCL